MGVDSATNSIRTLEDVVGKVLYVECVKYHGDIKPYPHVRWCRAMCWSWYGSHCIW